MLHYTNFLLPCCFSMVSGIALDLPPSASVEDNSPFYSQTSNVDFKDETKDENV